MIVIMRSLFLVLLLANLLVFAAQFAVVRDLVWTAKTPPHATQLNAERLRIMRDTSATIRPGPTLANAPPG